MDKKTIKEYIRALEHITSYLRNLLDEELRAPEAPVDQYSSLVEFTDLRMLAKSDSWPAAVPADLICDNKEDEKLNRAAGILNNLITEDLKDKKFLDYGCGEGHVAFIAGSVIPTKISVGFDIETYPWNFEKFDKIKYNQRAFIESVNSAIKQTLGGFVRARKASNQQKTVTIKALT